MLKQPGKIVLVTGGTGSFGKGFVRLLLKKPWVRMVRVFSRDEHKQREMRAALGSSRISYYIGDVRDRDRLYRAMDGAHWVVHAAALKQAPLGETEPQEFIKTNVQGSLNVIEACWLENVERAILISTDKAVEPINLYGATKMCAERSFLSADKTRGTKKTRFSVVRYGNVAGTAGSVIPIYRSIPIGEPTPIFDPEATRFWITLEDANKFVLDSLLKMKGGEVFIPKMKSVRVVDIARAIRPYSKIKVLGPREGDKPHEVLSVNGHRYSSDKNEFLSIGEIRKYANSHSS